MNMLIFKMKIIDKQDKNYIIDIFYKNNSTQISFSPDTKELIFIKDNIITDILKNNEYQLRKILHNKRKNTFFIGFILSFSLRDNKDVKAFNDRTKIIVLDKRNNNVKSYVIDKGEKNIDKIYIDGSYLEKRKMGGYTVLHKDLNNNYHLHVEKTDIKSSSLLELLAAIKGLEILKNIEKIRIITDSQYVRKGLTEWIVNWELNNWKTANGEPVKNREYWEKYNILSKNKYIEFKWVKAHSNHFENTLCDLYAKETANK